MKGLLIQKRGKVLYNFIMFNIEQYIFKQVRKSSSIIFPSEVNSSEVAWRGCPTFILSRLSLAQLFSILGQNKTLVVAEFGFFWRKGI